MQQHKHRTLSLTLIAGFVLVLSTVGCGTGGAAPGPSSDSSPSSPASASGTHSVTLSWSPSTTSVIGYNIYRGSQSGGPYTQVNSFPQSGEGYSDHTIQPGLTYFYVVTAVDSNSQESAYSNEAVATIPTP